MIRFLTQFELLTLGFEGGFDGYEVTLKASLRMDGVVKNYAIDINFQTVMQDMIKFVKKANPKHLHTSGECGDGRSEIREGQGRKAKVCRHCSRGGNGNQLGRSHRGGGGTAAAAATNR